MLAAATLLTYWPVVHCEFITYDDPQYVTENPTVRAGLSARGVAWAFRSAHAANWHPLTWLSHMLDCQLYGLRPFGHHLTNLLFHTANAPLLFLVLGRLTGAQWRSAFVAAMFALHPTHVESVAWISERKDLLSTCFGLLSLWAYAGYIMSVEGRGSQGKSEIGNPKSGALPKSETRTAKPQVHGSGSNSDKSRAGVQGSGLVCSISHFRTSTCYLLSLLLFALSLMSKPMLVTLPFVMLLLDYWPLGRVRIESLLPLIREKLPFVGLGVGSSVITVFVQQRGEALATFEHLPVAVRLCHVPVAYLLYLLKAVWPARLAVFYPLPPECAAGQAAAAGLLLAGVSVGAEPRVFVPGLVLVSRNVGAGYRLGSGRLSSHGGPLHLSAVRWLVHRVGLGNVASRHPLAASTPGSCVRGLGFGPLLRPAHSPAVAGLAKHRNAFWPRPSRHQGQLGCL